MKQAVKHVDRELGRLHFAVDVFTDLSLQAVEAREFSAAARSLLYLVLGAVGVPRGMLFSCDAAGRLTMVAEKGSRRNGNGNGHEIAAGSRVKAASSTGRHSGLSELGESPEMVSASDRRLPAPVRAQMQEAGMAQAVPLALRGRLTGLLAIGPRLDGSLVDGVERATLETLARYAAVLLHQQDLVHQLRAAVDENLRLCESLANTYFDTVQAFSRAIDAKDVYTRGHSLRVARYSAGLATRLALPVNVIDGIRIGAYLHDIGKLVLDRSLLNKPGSLSENERREVLSHPMIGFEVLSSVAFPWPEVRPVVRSHHERVDGKGYPDGLSAKEIPMPARLLAVCDAFDAMTSNRPYRNRMPVAAALQELVRWSGQQFDPTMVRAFLEQCRDEASPADARERERPTTPEKRRASKLRVFGPLLERTGGVTASMVEKLLRALGPVPALEPA